MTIDLMQVDGLGQGQTHGIDKGREAFGIVQCFAQLVPFLHTLERQEEGDRRLRAAELLTDKGRRRAPPVG